MPITYRVELTADERAYLEEFTSQGRQRVRALKRAQVLLLADGGGRREAEIVEALGVSSSTVYRVKRDFVEYGLAAALSEGSRPGQPRKTGAHEDALLVSIACSTPPAGRYRWTLSLLAERWVALTDMEAVSLECIRQRLKANRLKPWQQKMWCVGQLDVAYIAQMEHILDLYAEPSCPEAPVVNVDEAGRQLVGGGQRGEADGARPGEQAGL